MRISGVLNLSDDCLTCFIFLNKLDQPLFTSRPLFPIININKHTLSSSLKNIWRRTKKNNCSTLFSFYYFSVINLFLSRYLTNHPNFYSFYLCNTILICLSVIEGILVYSIRGHQKVIYVNVFRSSLI